MRGRTLLFSAILPLVVIFLLAFYGTTSKQLTHFLQARAAAIKLATAGFPHPGCLVVLLSDLSFSERRAGRWLQNRRFARL